MRLTGRFSRGTAIAAAAVAVLGVGGAVAAVAHVRSNSSNSAGPGGSSSGALTDASVRLSGLRHGVLAWNKHVRVVASNATLHSVRVTTRDGVVVNGALSQSQTRWTSQSQLMPMTHYIVKAVLADGSATATRTLHFRSTGSSKHLTALLSPGDGDVVGVGSPVIVRFSRPIPDNMRALVEGRFAVSTVPSLVGAWHWMNDEEMHWRPPTYWPAHTAVTVFSHLNGLYIGNGIWGQGEHQVSFHIGDSHISRVDVARHEMYVYQNRKLIKVFPISAGRDKYPTKNGVHITFEKSQVVTMDSATVGIPRNSPDGYYEKVYWDVRISYGGAFVHAAPWSVAEQGITNVSHGCVNISTSNAIWFYNWSLRGDIVDVYNSGAAPDTSDPGMADWNMSWKKWVAGDAAPTTTARTVHPPWPHDADPPAPPAGTRSPTYTPTYTPPSSSSPSPHHSPTAKPTKKPTAKPSPTPTGRHHH